MLNRFQPLIIICLALLLASCQKEPTGVADISTGTPSATAGSPALPQPTMTPSPTNSVLYLPLTGSDDPTATPTVTPTLIPTSTATPSLTPTPDYPVYDGPPLNRDDMGVQLHLHQEDVPWLFGHLRRLGVGWVKVQVSWKLYQPFPDRYAEDRFGELDSLVAAADNHDISVLLNVAKAPEWSRPTTEMDGPPIDYAHYERFMNHLAGRYQGRVAAYELWNEPNLQREWNGSPLSAADFVALMGMGAAGVRTADPSAILISGAPATTGINDRITAVDDRIYFREMLSHGAADVVDVIGAHPYGWANPPDSSAAAPDPNVVTHNDHPSFFFQDTLLDYAAILNEFDISRQIWVTEFGWGSFEGLGADPPPGAEFMSAVSEWQQASYVLRAYQLAHEWEWMGPMILWNLNFGPTLGERFSESGYSVLRPDESRRPVYKSLAVAPKK